VKPLLAALLLIPLAALGQPAPTESVTVTGTRAREVVQGFVKSLTVPTHFAHKIARWETPVCPYVLGIKPEAADFVLKRIKAVAAEAGAKVSADPGCRYNIEIIFTRTPQALMDDVRKTSTDVLGYAVSSGEKDRLAQFTRPIQSWYVTQTEDRNGVTERDSPHTVNSGGVVMYLPCSMLQPPPADPGMCTLHNPYARKVATGGSMLGDRTRSLLENVLIVADPGKLTDFELGAVSDHIAMLALAQLPALEGCPALPSITSLLSTDCVKVSGLTGNDRAYLRGLYQMPGDMDVSLQRNAIAAEMLKTAEPPP
jgi:hypothetical protein